MEYLIYQKDNVISSELCNQFIQKYKTDCKHDHAVNYRYDESNKAMVKAIRNGIDQYILQCFYGFSKDVGNKDILTDYYSIQKIAANSSLGYEPPIISNTFNYFSFVIYLNTVDQACDTFIDRIQIPAIEGQLVIFPCDWTFPYKHGSSTTEDKYVLKGNVFFHNT